MNTFLQVLTIVLSSSVVSGVVSIITMIINRKDKNNKQTAGLRILLYDRIKHLGRCYIEAGEVVFDDLEDLDAMHKVYHDDLNGNGYLDNIMMRVHALPLKGGK
ncbi:MAG: hypothetical protein EOM54_05595 [Clostridia bacterium]|nr:hypothetical protein [Clostridia bacterium]